jgi:hypothetical protein
MIVLHKFRINENETFSIDPPNKESNQLKDDEVNVVNYAPYDALDRLHSEGFTGTGIKVGIWIREWITTILT